MVFLRAMCNFVNLFNLRTRLDEVLFATTKKQKQTASHCAEFGYTFVKMTFYSREGLQLRLLLR